MATLRYRTARDHADRLGQVFTPPDISRLLAGSMPVPQGGVRYVVDLGAGEGALASAALARHPNANALLVELDQRLAKQLRRQMPDQVKVVCADALGHNWGTELPPSWIVSNPAYGYTALKPGVRKMLDASGLAIPRKGDWVRGDAAFLARTWGLADVGTGIGLIIAAPIIRDPSFEEMRRQLISQMGGLCATRLEETTFENAEVRAYLLSGMRALSRQRSVLLRKADAAGHVIDEMKVSFASAVKSLDIDFHRALEKFGMCADKVVDTLGSIGASIVRGSRSYQDFQRMGLEAFHTTDFDPSRPAVHLRGALRGYQTAGRGHILIPRVGSRCLVRQTRVDGGEGLFTESVYRLTLKAKDRRRVWNSLKSSFGSEWRLANAAGSCAKHLTVQTLATMPILG